MSTSQNNIEKFEQYLRYLALETPFPRPDAREIKTLCKMPTNSPHQSTEKFTLQQTVKEAQRLTIEADDGRERIEKTTEWPYSVHGIVAFDFDEIRSWGTGTLIGPNIVLTAAHNIYSHKYNTYATLETMQFLPGVNGQELPFGFTEVEKYFLSPNFITERKEDYGILILKEPIGHETGYFGLACLESEELKEKYINIYGYPYDKVKNRPNTYEMWGMKGEVDGISITQSYINYSIDTSLGQDGSSVWYQEEEDYYICGIHGHGLRDLSINRGTFLTRALYKQIYKWISEISDNQSFLQFDNIKELQLFNSKIDTEYLSILEELQLNKLSIVNLSRTEIGPTETKVLGQIPWINLTVLNLSENSIGDRGARGLAQNTSWVNLSVLNLSENKIGDEGAQALAENKSWINLSVLDLSENKIGNEGAEALAENRTWIKISELSLNENRLSNQVIAKLSEKPWINFSILNFRKKKIGEEEAQALARNTAWSSFSGLNFIEDRVEDKEVQALAQSSPGEEISVFDLNKKKIDNEGAQALARNVVWNFLGFDPFENRVENKRVQALAQFSPWEEVSVFDLNKKKIDNERAQALAQNAAWNFFSGLNLFENRVENKGVQALAQFSPWEEISVSDLSKKKIDNEISQALAQNSFQMDFPEWDLNKSLIYREESQAIKNLSDESDPFRSPGLWKFQKTTQNFLFE